MICPNCQTDNREGAKFCDECGTRLGVPADVAPVETDEAAAVVEDIEEVETTSEGPEECADVPAQQEGQDAEGDQPDAAEADARDELAKAEQPVETEQGEQAEDAEEASDAEQPKEAECPEGQEGEVEGDRQQKPVPDQTADIPAQSDPALSGLDVSVPEVFEVTPINLDGSDVDSAARTMQIPAIPAEKIASEGYTKPQSAWESGGTLEMPRVEGAQLPNADFRAPDPHAKKMRRKQSKELRKQQKAAEREAKRASGESASGGKGKIVGLVAAIIVLAGAIAVGTYSMELWGGKTVPSCQGKTAADASYILQNAGFTVRMNEVPSDDTEGLVLLTDPASGARVPDGSEVVVHVAASRVIPDISGMTEEEALAALAKDGYTNVADVVYQKSDDYDGVVIGVDPEVGTKAKSATTVTITVAQAYTVPDVVGVEEYEAIDQLKQAGYEVKVNHVADYSVTAGHVISSSPEAGTKLNSGSYVALSVALSRGSVLESKAQTYLKSAELTKDGTACKVVSVDEVSYVKDGVVSFTVTAKPYASLFGQTVYGPEQTISGSISYNSSDELASVKVG